MVFVSRRQVPTILEGKQFRLGAAGNPHKEPIRQYTAKCTTVNHKLLRDLSTLEFPQVEEALLGFPITKVGVGAPG